MRPRSLPSLVVALAIALGCKKKPPPRVEPLGANESDARPRRTGGKWERLPTFSLPGEITSKELMRISGSRLRVEVRRPSAGGLAGDVVIVLDMTGKALSTRAREPNAVAVSFDGGLQFVTTATGFERLDVDSGERTPWAGTAPQAISDDLRLVVGTHAGASETDVDVDEIATGKRLCSVALPQRGGSPPTFSFMGGGRFVVFGNSRGVDELELASCGPLRDHSQCSGMSDDGLIAVEFPCYVYTRPWVDSFTVIDQKAGAELRKLSMTIAKEPQQDAPTVEAVLTPKGDRVFVVFNRELIELRVSDGKETHRESVDDLLSKSAWPMLTLLTSDDVVVIESEGKVTPFTFPAEI
jgi:hypothetical protein